MKLRLIILIAAISAGIASVGRSSERKTDQSAVSFAVTTSTASTISMMVRDAKGQRVGIGSDGKIVQEIPGSAAFIDAADDDDEAEPEEVTREANIASPRRGSYAVALSGEAGTEFQLFVYPYATDGSPVEGRCVKGTVDEAGVNSYVFTIDTQPGSTVTVKDALGKDITETAVCDQ